MKNIKDINLEEIKQLETILKFKIVTGIEVNIMQRFAQTFIDDSMHICGHCQAQIRFAHKRITNFAERNKEFIDNRKNELETIEANSHKCLQCNNLIQDGRKKYCSNSCKKKYKG